jgi:hypothetical protein
MVVFVVQNRWLHLWMLQMGNDVKVGVVAKARKRVLVTLRPLGEFGVRLLSNEFDAGEFQQLRSMRLLGYVGAW